MTPSEAYLEGFIAFNCCIVRTGNPYIDLNVTQWADWNSGWLRARELFYEEELEG